MKNINLSNRLEKVLSMIKKVDTLIDIGTDHAFLPIKAVLTKKARKVIAMDKRRGPLSRARENIKKYGLEDKIEVILSDGFLALNERNDLIPLLLDVKRNDTIPLLLDVKGNDTMPLPSDEGKNFKIVSTISGMGGNTVIDIIGKSFSFVKALSYIVIQPQSEIALLRKFLDENGFIFLDEDIVLSDNKYYFFMKVKFSNERDKSAFKENDIYKGINTFNRCDVLEYFYMFGPILLQKKDKVFISYLKSEIKKDKLILKNIEKSIEKNIEKNIELNRNQDSEGKTFYKDRKYLKKLKLIKKIKFMESIINS